MLRVKDVPVEVFDDVATWVMPEPWSMMAGSQPVQVGKWLFFAVRDGSYDPAKVGNTGPASGQMAVLAVRPDGTTKVLDQVAVPRFVGVFSSLYPMVDSSGSVSGLIHVYHLENLQVAVNYYQVLKDADPTLAMSATTAMAAKVSRVGVSYSGGNVAAYGDSENACLDWGTFTWRTVPQQATAWYVGAAAQCRWVLIQPASGALQLRLDGQLKPLRLPQSPPGEPARTRMLPTGILHTGPSETGYRMAMFIPYDGSPATTLNYQRMIVSGVTDTDWYSPDGKSVVVAASVKVDLATGAMTLLNKDSDGRTTHGRLIGDLVYSADGIRPFGGATPTVEYPGLRQVPLAIIDGQAYFTLRVKDMDQQPHVPVKVVRVAVKKK